MKSTILTAMLAILTFSASAGAAAQGWSGPVVRTSHRAVQQAQYGEPHHYEPRYQDRRHARCGAPRWDPSVRYMPGQVVWRRGELWMARGISARVYNENSPPEWTPNYWRPAVCG